MSPLISVVIPFYNSQNSLKDCLNAVFKSTYKNYEVIVKYKTGEEANFYHIPKYIPNNLKFIHGGSGYQLLKDCKLGLSK